MHSVCKEVSFVEKTHPGKHFWGRPTTFFFASKTWETNPATLISKTTSLRQRLNTLEKQNATVQDEKIVPKKFLNLFDVLETIFLMQFKCVWLSSLNVILFKMIEVSASHFSFFNILTYFLVFFFPVNFLIDNFHRGARRGVT